MQERELTRLVDSTADAAFAIDAHGTIVAWNAAAATLFGRSAKEALGKACGGILEGSDECGPVCSAQCGIRHAVQDRKPIHAFDLQVATPQGRTWCTISVLRVEGPPGREPYSLHVVRPVHTRKKLELLVRDFLVAETTLSAEEARSVLASTRSASGQVQLTQREREVLALLASGTKTATIAEHLHISRTTVNNHVQRILKKLGVHSRLEAVRRAEHAGLLRPGRP